MTVDHILFNKHKWYSIAGNADNVTANGRKYAAMPVSFTIPEGTHLYDGTHGDGFTLSTDCNVTCVGTSGEFYYFCGTIEFTESYGGNDGKIDNPKDVSVSGRNLFNPPLFVEKDEVKNIRW